MKVYEYEGKNLNELKKEALTELNASEDELYIYEEEILGGFLKSKKYKLRVLSKDEVIQYAKTFIIDIAKAMNINVKIEAKKREKYIQLNLFSEKSSILIGQNGKNLEALQILLKYSILANTNFKVNIILDVEDYKEKINKHLEYNVKKIAREVRKTGIEVKLDPMNSYERRIVHNAINEIKGISTISEGEEPNRYIVIRKED